MPSAAALSREVRGRPGVVMLPAVRRGAGRSVEESPPRRLQQRRSGAGEVVSGSGVDGAQVFGHALHVCETTAACSGKTQKAPALPTWEDGGLFVSTARPRGAAGGCGSAGAPSPPWRRPGHALVGPVRLSGGCTEGPLTSARTRWVA